jgi:hypothetical protein
MYVFCILFILFLRFLFCIMHRLQPGVPQKYHDAELSMRRSRTDDGDAAAKSLVQAPGENTPFISDLCGRFVTWLILV